MHPWLGMSPSRESLGTGCGHCLSLCHQEVCAVSLNHTPSHQPQATQAACPSRGDWLPMCSILAKALGKDPGEPPAPKITSHQFQDICGMRRSCEPHGTLKRRVELGMGPEGRPETKRKQQIEKVDILGPDVCSLSSREDHEFNTSPGNLW